MNKNLNVILLKTNDAHSADSTPATGTSTGSADRYVDYLKNEVNLSVKEIVQISLLSFVFTHETELIEKLKSIFYAPHETTKPYSSLILTSKQTVEAIENALIKLSLTLDTVAKRESKLCVYCVGEATADKFRNLISQKRFEINPHLVEIKLTEKTSQNAKHLAKLVIAESDPEHSSVFYPCSSIRKDELSEELTKANIRFDELKVYETKPAVEKLNHVRTLIESYSQREQTTCLVFFSPSGVDTMFSVDKMLANFLLINKDVRFVSIGPSTSKRLREVTADVLRIYELSSPSPQSLAETLNNNLI